MTEKSPRPALDELHGEQKRLAKSLLDGFDSWTDTYKWTHGVLVYSGGHLSDDVVTAAVPGPAGGMLVEALHHDKQEHKHLRQSLLANEVMPAFRSGLKELRWKATEYGENPPDADRSEHTALRPAYDSLASKQRDVMIRGLSGFEDRDGLLEWVHDAERASLGEMPEDMAMQLGFRDQHALESFIASEYRRDNPEPAAFVRFMTVGKMVLPRFKTALSKQVQRASEQSVEVEEEPETFELTEEFTDR